MRKPIPPLQPETRARWPHPTRGPWQLVGHWIEVDGYLECVGVELWKGVERKPDYSLEQFGEGAAAISGNDLRLPTAQLLRALRAQGRWIAEHGRAEFVRQAEAAADSPEDAKRFREISEAMPSFDRPRQRRTTSHDLDHFQEVSRVYLQAQVDRVPPTREVAKRLHLARGTAEKHVRAARKLGLLPPTKQGRASRPTPLPADAKRGLGHSSKED